MDVEDRLRHALRARAGQVTSETLRPALPPTAVTVRRSWRRWWQPLVVAALTAVAAVAVVGRFQDDTPPRPVPNPPAATIPSGSPRPATPPGTPPTTPPDASPESPPATTPTTTRTNRPDTSTTTRRTPSPDTPPDTPPAPTAGENDIPATPDGPEATPGG